MASFQKIHETLYHTDSSGYAPFAYWKMKALCEDAEAFSLPEFECYYVIRDSHLLIYSSADNLCHIPLDELNKLSGICMKAEMLDSIKDHLSGFQVSYAECLYYDFSYQPKTMLYDYLGIVKFDFSNEDHYRIASEIINQGSDWLNADNIKKMTSFPSFDPSLWFFIHDKSSNELVGFCISTFDKFVKETDLDWIYIRPHHHGKGAGRYMIEEIIRRSINRSNIIRVSGTAEFYKRCGFYNKQLWVWAVKPGYSFVAPAIQP